jgi:hypothetical protein
MPPFEPPSLQPLMFLGGASATGLMLSSPPDFAISLVRLSRYPIERLRIIPIYPPRIQKIRAVPDISMTIINKSKCGDFALNSPPSQRSGRYAN